MKKAFSAQSLRGGLALRIIAAAVVTGPSVWWPDLSHLEFLPLFSGILSALHSGPLGPLRVRCVRWCLKLRNRRNGEKRTSAFKFSNTSKRLRIFFWLQLSRL